MSLLGQRLRQERETRGLALLQIELDTRIRANLIQALEDGNLENLPPEPFLRGLLRTYANYLRIDPKELLDLYVADMTPAVVPGAKPLIIQRPIAGPHPPATRPEVDDRPPSRQFSPQPQPLQTPPSTPEPSRTLADPPINRESSQPSQKRDAPRSNPLTDSFKALGRRLPLAPPSARPAKPVLRPANAEPPPSVPPEILPPPEYITPSEKPAITLELAPISESETAPTAALVPHAPVEESAPGPTQSLPEPIIVSRQDKAEAPPAVADVVQAETSTHQITDAESAATAGSDTESTDESERQAPIVAEPVEATSQPPVAEDETPIPTPPPYQGDGHEPIGQEIPTWVHVEPQAVKATVEETQDQDKADARRNRLKATRFAIMGVGAIIVVVIIALAVILVSSIIPDVSGIANVRLTATPTRAETIPPSPTLLGTIPTGIPVIDATAAPFTPVALIPTQAPTSRAATPTRSSGTEGVLNVEIIAAQPITAQIGIDGVVAFNGTVATGTSVSYSAQQSLYIRIENLPGGTVTFNGRKQLPLNFAERSMFERQWNASTSGKITAVNPVAPSPAKTATPIPALNPLPSATPLRSPTPRAITPTVSVTPSISPTSTISPTNTVAPTGSATPSSTPTRSGPTPTLTPFS